MRIDRNILGEVARLKLATPGVAAGRQHGDRHSPFLGRGVEFADYRPYGPGDDLRLVDWNVRSAAYRPRALRLAWKRRSGQAILWHAN